MSTFKYNNIHINVDSVNIEFNEEEDPITLLKIDEKPSFKSTAVEREFIRLESLLEELRQLNLPREVISDINYGIRSINGFLGQNESIVGEKLTKVKLAILWTLKTELHILPDNYYRSRYSFFGILPFDLPLGLILGGFMGNGYYIIAGFLLGVILSRQLGSLKDNEIKKQNRQLNYKDWDFSTSTEREYF